MALEFTLKSGFMLFCFAFILLRLSVGVSTREIITPPRCKDMVCPFNYDPVCAYNCFTRRLRTFGNDCQLQAANCGLREWAVLCKGECFKRPIRYRK